MKVLVITTVRFRQNGITSVIMNYYRNLDNNIVHMDFVGPNVIDDFYQIEFKEKGSNYTQLSSRKKNLFKYMCNLYRLLRQEKYDIVHVHGSSRLISIELLVAKIAGVKVRIAHSHSTRCDYIWVHRILLPFFRFLYTHAVACSKEAGQWMYEKKEYIILKNGINIGKFRFNENVRIAQRSILKIHENDIVIGHVGGFITVKNHKFIIELAEKIVQLNSKYKFLLIGDGELFSLIHSKILEKGLDKNIFLLGNKKNIEDYYNVMDLFILPSLYEGEPVVLVESSANGLNSLVSNTLFREDDRAHSVLYLEYSLDKWVDSISDNIICDIKLREYLSEENCKRLIESGYSIDLSASTLLDFYNSSLSLAKGGK